MSICSMRNVFVLALVVFVMSFSPVLASDVSIAVVDVQKLLTQSKAAKSIQKQVKTEREKFLSNLSKEEENLRKMEKELVEESKNLVPEKLAEKKKAFENKFTATQRTALEGKSRIEKAVGEAMAKLNKAAFEAIESVAEKEGYNLILPKQHIVASDKSIDISDQSMEQLNKAVADIAVKF